MCKKIILFLLIFFLWIPLNLMAQTDKSVKVKQPSVIKKGIVLSNRLDLPEPSHDKPYQPGHWRRPVTDDPHVVKDGNIYRMYLSGLGSPPNLYPHVPAIWSLGEATAPHPEGPWTISNNDKPLLSSFGWIGGWGGGHIISSMYMYDPIEKKGKVIYQCSTGEPEDGTKIGRTDADYPDEGSELFSAKAYTIADPFLVHDGKNYHLFYSKQVNNVWQTWKRKASTWKGLADASSAKCIMPAGGSSGLTNYKGTWYMVYSGWYDPGTPYDYLTHKNKLFLAISKDLEKWTPAFDGNPVFEPDGVHDQYGAQDPCIFIEDDVAYIYYSGMRDPENNGENDTSICMVNMKLKDIKLGQATQEPNSKEWKKIKRIVSKQTLLSDDSRINAFAEKSVSSYKGEKYDWVKEKMIIAEKITMVALYASENTCADELFAKIPDYLTFKETVDIGYPIKFYSVNDKIEKFTKKVSKNNSLIPSIDVKVSFHPKLFIKGYHDDYYLRRNKLETDFRPGIKLVFPASISSGIEWRFKRIWDPDINQIEAYRGYIQFYRMFDSPLTLILGRQELSFGRKFLMGELDGYDAVHLLLDTPLKINLFAGTRNEGEGVFDFDERNDSRYYEVLEVVPGDFEKDVFGLTLGHEFNSRLKSEAYIFYKEKKGDEKKADQKEEKTKAIGLRTQYELMENLQLNAEITKQLGTIGEADRKAWGGYIQSILNKSDTMFKPEFRLEYAYLSGDDLKSKEKNEDFDIFSGDNLYSDIKWGRVRNVKKNMHIFNLGVSFIPYDTMVLDLFYSLFRRDNYEYYEGSKIFSLSKNEGQELDLKIHYPITKHIAFSAFAGVFWPDNAYENHPDNYKAAVKKQFEVACQAIF